MSRTPKEIVEDLAPAYRGWKENEKDKEKYKKEFLAAVTEELAEGDLAETVVTVNETNEDRARTLVEKQHPAFTVVDSRPHPEDNEAFEFIIQENPAYKSYTIEFDGYVWGRQVVSGSTFVDDERMLEEDPNLYIEVTEYEGEKLIRPFAEWLIDPQDPNITLVEAIEGYFESHFEGKRVLRNFDELTPEQLAKVQAYVYEGKPSVKLPSPKKAEDG